MYIVSVFEIAMSALYYLDPGSGSILVQLIIATLLGILMLLRTQWSRLKSLFKRNEKNRDENSQDDH